MMHGQKNIKLCVNLSCYVVSYEEGPIISNMNGKVMHHVVGTT